jgi:hypothetical protein
LSRPLSRNASLATTAAWARSGHTAHGKLMAVLGRKPPFKPERPNDPFITDRRRPGRETIDTAAQQRSSPLPDHHDMQPPRPMRAEQ